MNFDRRYSRYLPDGEEIVMLKGKGCFWKKCRFCDYYLDAGAADECIPLNHRVLARVTGEFGRLVVLNSGSYFELPEATRDEVLDVINDRGITNLVIETHWQMREATARFKETLRQSGVVVQPRIGIETFDEDFREKVMLKGMDYGVDPAEIAAIYDECCLLFGIAGQSIETLREDLRIAKNWFGRIYLNIYNANSAELPVDMALIQQFAEEEYAALKKDPQLRVLMDNKALGVGD